MGRIEKILVLSFVGSVPETAAELHQQLKSELEPDACFEDVEQKLNKLSAAYHIHSAQKPDGSVVYWRE